MQSRWKACPHDSNFTFSYFSQTGTSSSSSYVFDAASGSASSFFEEPLSSVGAFSSLLFDADADSESELLSFDEEVEVELELLRVGKISPSQASASSLSHFSHSLKF